MHRGVDGYSRLPLLLHASSNNQAATVLKLFTRVVEEYGLLSQVRCDKGGENNEVRWFMLNYHSRGPGRGSIIAGTWIELSQEVSISLCSLIMTVLLYVLMIPIPLIFHYKMRHTLLKSTMFCDSELCFAVVYLKLEGI